MTLKIREYCRCMSSIMAASGSILRKQSKWRSLPEGLGQEELALTLLAARGNSQTYSTEGMHFLLRLIGLILDSTGTLLGDAVVNAW